MIKITFPHSTDLKIKKYFYYALENFELQSLKQDKKYELYLD